MADAAGFGKACGAGDGRAMVERTACEDAVKIMGDPRFLWKIVDGVLQVVEAESLESDSGGNARGSERVGQWEERGDAESCRRQRSSYSIVADS